MKIHRTFDPSINNYDTLVEKIHNNNSENTCRDSLIDFCNYLGFLHHIHLEVVITELAAFDAKRSDLIIVGTDRSLRQDYEFALLEKKVIIYECKSCKKNPLKKTKSGLHIPTESLSEAEAQLNYYYHLLTNQQNLQEHINASKIDLQKGGIIIGKNIPLNNEDNKNMAISLSREKTARSVMYKNLFSWDDIVNGIQDHFFK